MSTRYPHLHPCQNFDFLDFAKGNQTPNTKHQVWTAPTTIQVKL